MSLNLHRRHLTDQQRAFVALQIKEQVSAESHIRKVQYLKQFEAESSENIENLPLPSIDGNGRSETSAQHAARLVQVSAESHIRKVQYLKQFEAESSENIENLPLPSIDGNGRSETSAQHAARLVQVSATAVERAQYIVSKGVPEVVAAAKAATISLSKAVEIARLPAESQIDALSTEAPITQEKVRETPTQQVDSALATVKHWYREQARLGPNQGMKALAKIKKFAASVQRKELG